jgi:hypothetical protein
MSSERSPTPAPEEGLLYHQRLLCADPVVPSDVCHAFLAPLTDGLAARHPRYDPHLIREAVHQTLFDYVKRPEMYQPGDGRPDLLGFLTMAADRDLANLLRRERLHHRNREPWSVVEFGAEGGNTSGADDPAEAAEWAEEQRRDEEALARLTAAWPAVERECLELMLQGVRPFEPYAALLGLSDWPVERQRHEVNKMKERLIKRLRRQGRGHD